MPLKEGDARNNRGKERENRIAASRLRKEAAEAEKKRQKAFKDAKAAQEAQEKEESTRADHTKVIHPQKTVKRPTQEPTYPLPEYLRKEEYKKYNI